LSTYGSLVPAPILQKASRRGQSKLSGPRESANLRDIQHTICYADNHTGWRKFPVSIRRIFRSHSEERQRDYSENTRSSKHQSSTRLQLARRPAKRKLNRAFELVGVELNPGPGPKDSKPKPKGKGKKNTGKAKGGVIVRLVKPQRGTNTNVNGYTAEAAAYLRTVLAPCAGNARIPDFNCLPTTLTTFTQDISWTTNASGIGGGYVTLGSIPTYTGENTGTTTDSTFTYTASNQFTGVTAYQAAYKFSRLVSACVDIMYTGSTLNDGGIVVGWTLAGLIGTSEDAPTSVVTAQATRSNQTSRIREGLSLFYRPTDSTCFDFRDTGANYTVGILGFHFTGLAASTNLQVKVTLNFECIPKVDTLSSAMTNMSGGLKPSPVDPAGHAKAVSLISSQKPFTSFHQAEQLTKSMSNTANNLHSVWETAKSIFGIAATVGKYLV
jgi:hypothetical protein